MIEIERKFRLSEDKRQQVKDLLQAQGVNLKETHQIDQVFLFKIDSFKEFKQGDVVVRLRTVDDRTIFTLKRIINEQGDSIEHELEVSSHETMQFALEEMGYKQVTIVDKKRIEVKQNDVTIVLDTVDKLGDFLEIEILAEDSEEGAELRILQTAHEFGLTADDIETKKYDQLLASL